MSDPQVVSLLTDFIVNEVAATPPGAPPPPPHDPPRHPPSPAPRTPAPAPAAPPAPDFPIIEGGLVDSLGLFKVIAFIEEKFGVAIPPEEIVLENFATIGAIATLVAARAGR